MAPYLRSRVAPLHRSVTVGSNLTLSEILEHLELAENQLNRKVNPTCYTVTEFRKRLATKDSFVNQVLSQPNIELIGSMNAFRAIE